MELTEAELYSKKWFDYRILRPHACDLKFIESYVEEGLIHNEIVGNSKYSNPICKLDLNNYNRWRQRSFIKRLRRVADTFGMPYHIFWLLAYRTIRNMHFKYTYLSSYANKELLKRTVEAWIEFESQTIIKSSNKLFSVELYKELDIQDKYYDYLMRKIIKKYGSSGSSFTEKIKKMVQEKEVPAIYISKNIKKICGDFNGNNG